MAVHSYTWNKSDPTAQIFMALECFFFRKSVKNTQVPLKSNKNNGYFTRRPVYIYNNISLSSSYNEECFIQKL
jgi:hypothetical protein